jgi:carboxypeptidase D
MVVLATVFVTFFAVASTAGARMMRKDEARMRQTEAAKRWQRSAGPSVLDPTNVKRSGVQNITFTNPKASGEFGMTAVTGDLCYL